MRRLASTFVLGIVVATIAPDARAQDSHAVAEALFTAGRTAAQKGDYAAACELLQESYRLDPATGTLLNVADCLERTGKLATAWLSYTDAVRSLGADDRRAVWAQKKLREIERRVPHLTIRVEKGAPAETTIRVRGIAMSRSGEGVPLPVDPGTFDVDVDAPGHEGRKIAITLAEGEAREIDVAPGPALSAAPVAPSVPAPAIVAPAPRPAVDPAPPAPPSSWSAWRVAAVSGAVLGLAVGVTTGVMAMGARSDLDQRCQGTRCPPDVDNDVSRYNTLRTVSTAGFITLGVSAAGFGALLLFDGRASRRTARVAPWIGPTSAGVSTTF